MAYTHISRTIRDSDKQRNMLAQTETKSIVVVDSFFGRVCRHIWRYSGAATQNIQRFRHLTLMRKKAREKNNNNEIANFEGKMEKCHTYCRAACAMQWRAQGNKKQLHLDISCRFFFSFYFSYFFFFFDDFVIQFFLDARESSDMKKQ